MKIISNLFIVAFLVFSCSSGQKESSNQSQNDQNFESLNKDFGDYWYQGKAELNHYKLTQARYGQQNPGKAVLVFVTEDFLTDKQVKYEEGDKENTTTVLKLNFLKRFVTGMYDYSMMSSIFTPVQLNQYPHSLKISTSSQDWCGHAYFQLNNREDQYDVVGHSYFQNEVHKDFQLDKALLEDEIWNRIRINPESLPEGSIQIIPGTMYERLKHKTLQVMKASANLQPYQGSEFEGNNLMEYYLDYKEIPRQLRIVFEKAFPHKIKGWKEKHKSGFGDDTKILTSKAKLKKTVKTDYWNKNGLSDTLLRKQLGLDSRDL